MGNSDRTPHRAPAGGRDTYTPACTYAGSQRHVYKPAQARAGMRTHACESGHAQAEMFCRSTRRMVQEHMCACLHMHSCHGQLHSDMTVTRSSTRAYLSILQVHTFQPHTHSAPVRHIHPHPLLPRRCCCCCRPQLAPACRSAPCPCQPPCCPGPPSRCVGAVGIQAPMQAEDAGNSPGCIMKGVEYGQQARTHTYTYPQTCTSSFACLHTSTYNIQQNTHRPTHLLLMNVP